MFLANFFHDTVNLIRLNLVRLLSCQPKQNGVIGAVTMTCQRQRSVQLDHDARNRLEQSHGFQFDRKSPRRSHRAYRMRTGGSNPNLE